MRVKRLEVQGFKSFKDKTIIHFDDGITGVVGPNGCGKSNIVDAFFWVMGEQSYKHMRGSSSDDLIFNGSSKYAPAGIAEATLVMETDFDENSTGEHPSGATVKDIPLHLRAKEIAVTRRLYRGGEGEYFINGVQARLRDIKELFMDTGVGAKGYSVIEQGQIGKIVNAKPEDRRILIEEAAGIAKYKARKTESLRKMESAQGNLSRLNDVLAEIERSMNSLERQAQKARKYREYKDELLDKEMTWGRRKTKVLQQRLDALSVEKQTVEQELVGMKAEVQVSENLVEIERITQLTDTKSAEDLQSQIQRLSDDLTHEKAALDLSKRRQSDLENQLQTLEQEMSDLRAAIATEEERLVTLDQDSKAAEENHKNLAQKAREFEEEVRALRLSTDESRRELEKAKSDLLAGIQEASHLQSRRAGLESRLESARAQAERVQAQIIALQERFTGLESDLGFAREGAELQRTKLDSLKTQKTEQAEDIQRQEKALVAEEKTRDDNLKSLAQIRSRLQSLEDLAQAYEGFGDAPRAAIEWARTNNSSSFSVLADAYDVDAGYESALEGWLEGQLESLISSESKMALDAISHIRDGKSGRIAVHVAAASPTGSIGSWDFVQESLQQAGFKILGQLQEVVKTSTSVPAQIGEIASSLVDGVALVESLDPLPQFLANGGMQNLMGWAIVSRDGNALDRDGTLRGGTTQSSISETQSEAASVLKRKRAIVELKDAVAAAETAHAQSSDQASSTREKLIQARERIGALQSEIQEVEIQLTTFERDIHQLDKSTRECSQQLEQARNEGSRAQAEISQSETGISEIDSQLEALLAARTEEESKIREAEDCLRLLEEKYRDRDAELTQMRVVEASDRERSQSLRRELESARGVIVDRERRVAEIARTVERARTEKDSFSGGEGEMQEKIVTLTTTLAEQREQLSIVKDRLEQSTAKMNEVLGKVKELTRSVESFQSRSMEMAIEFEKVSSELTHLVQNLEEKYGPGCLERPVTSPIQEEMEAPVVTAEISAEEEQKLGEEVESLRERIRRLGEVNVNAIEEYEETKTRFDHLNGEKLDLEASVQNLQDAIEHINKTSEDRFRKAFEAIAERFERLFPIIFGGGQAKLSLLYPEGSTDILEAGVDIMAQPPGKKIVNIGLLSGGEKALTAVSLIFAIFMVKPSPFCILDEVDAPLDDANIGRFNALLREMSSTSQFILITHNKKTMELNDVLYGVTMEEPGVSKMVSIQLS